MCSMLNKKDIKPLSSSVIPIFCPQKVAKFKNKTAEELGENNEFSLLRKAKTRKKIVKGK